MRVFSCNLKAGPALGAVVRGKLGEFSRENREQPEHTHEGGGGAHGGATASRETVGRGDTQAESAKLRSCWPVAAGQWTRGSQGAVDEGTASKWDTGTELWRACRRLFPQAEPSCKHLIWVVGPGSTGRGVRK